MCLLILHKYTDNSNSRTNTDPSIYILSGIWTILLFYCCRDICMCLPISFIRHGLVGKNLQIRVLRPTGWSGVRMDILRCCDISASVCIFHSVLDCPNIRTKIWFKCHNVKTICIQKTIVLRDLYYTGT